ncbi:MAG: glycerol-3-phosphate acyltransferase [Coriobacteriia bacterium]
MNAVAALALAFVCAYAIGSVPFAYLIAKGVTGEDITEHGTGNVGAMNVRRTTGSWGWFVIAMLADALKGFLPVVAITLLTARLTRDSATGSLADLRNLTDSQALSLWGPALVVIGTVVGHNWSLWLSIAKRRILGGKGLATGGGALIAYDWRYFVVVVTTGLLVIALTRYMMAGQVAAAASLPIYTLATGRPDWPFAVVLGLVVYLRHHRRFVGLLRGREPKMYVNDRMGPRG